MKRLLGACALLMATGTTASEPVHEYLATLRRFGINASVLVARDGKPILRESTMLPIETQYYIASVTKTFTATAILRLQQTGRLSLSDPITRFLADVPDDKRTITISQLLNHTSGIDHLYSADKAATRAEAVRAVLATELVNRPGAEENYSSDGYVLLAAIVEIASGQPYDKFVAREVFRPAGLKSVAFVGACSRRVARAVAPGAKGSPCALPAILARRGPTGIVANADDLSRWIDGAVRRRIFGDSFDGWEKHGTLIGHGGDDDVIGHNTMAFHDTASGRTVIVATNAGEFAGQSFAHVIAQRVMKLLDGAAVVHTVFPFDSSATGPRLVEGQAMIDTLFGAPVPGSADHNQSVSRLLEMLRAGKNAEIDSALTAKRGDYVRRWWTRLAPISASVLGTVPAWWSNDGGKATFLRIERASGSTIGRVEWNDDGTFRAFGGAAIPAPVVLLVKGAEAFDPANGIVVKVTR